MDIDIKNKWLSALRSGEYKQGYGYLKLKTGDGTCHCCLGVLCEVMSVPSTDIENARYYVFLQDKNEMKSYLSQDFLDEIGLQHMDSVHLAGMNDGSYFDFNAIADYIEEKL